MYICMYVCIYSLSSFGSGKCMTNELVGKKLWFGTAVTTPNLTVFLFPKLKNLI
jgi:hypothetical protein